MGVGLDKTTVKTPHTPISDLSIVTPELNGDFQNHYVSIAFYSDDSGRTLIPKSAMTGAVTFEATVNGVEYGDMLVGVNTEGILTLGGSNELLGEIAGSYLNVKATLAITDAATATHAVLTVNSYKG